MTEPIKMENWRVFLILMTDKKDSRIYGSFHMNIVQSINNTGTFSPFFFSTLSTKSSQHGSFIVVQNNTGLMTSKYQSDISRLKV